MTATALPHLAPAAGISPLSRAFQRPAAAPHATHGLADASKQFEALFLSLLVREMTQGLTGLFGDGAGSEVYRGMFESTLGQSLAGKGFGLASKIERALAPPTAAATPITHALAAFANANAHASENASAHAFPNAKGPKR